MLRPFFTLRTFFPRGFREPMDGKPASVPAGQPRIDRGSVTSCLGLRVFAPLRVGNDREQPASPTPDDRGRPPPYLFSVTAGVSFANECVLKWIRGMRAGVRKSFTSSLSAAPPIG
jgi:hypothetical protein